MADHSGPKKKRRVLLVGWDAADWKVISPMLDAGKMPVLESLIEGGVMGKLATLTPVLSPMLWTSIATGKRPYKHGIHGFVEPDPKKGGIRPITNLSRKTKAIWNILGQEGLKSNVIGWWPSHPAEPINGVMVSNHYQQVRGDSPDKWPLLKGTIHPSELASRIARFRVHPKEIEPSQIVPFVPRAAEIDHDKDERCWKIAKLLSECAGVHACSTAVMQNEEWDFMAIYHDAVDHFCHGFMKFHPPRQEHVSEQDFELYKDVVDGIYQFHDMMLGTLLKLVDEDTTVIVMSDHGFHPDHLRPKEIPQEPNGPAIEHSHLGIFVASGPGIKKDATVFGANLLDITPTLLTLFELPVGEDMDGRVLTEIWENPPEVKTIPSWEEVEGDDGRHPPHFQFDPADDQELLKQLVDLGYVEDPEDDQKMAGKNALRELQFNLARSYVDGARHGDSIPILEELVEDWPMEHRFLNQLAFSYLAVNRVEDARRMVEKIFEVKAILQKELEEEIPRLTKELEGKSEEEVCEEVKAELKAVREKYKSVTAPQNFLLGCLLIAENEPKKALEVLNQISPEAWGNADLPVRIGHLYLSLDKPKEAERCFNKALEIDPQSSRAYLALMQLMLEQNRYKEAAEYGFSSIGLQYFSPMSHFLLGKALMGLRLYDQAAEAFEVTLVQNPTFPEACLYLAELYETFLRKPKKGDEYRRRASRLRGESAEQKVEQVVERALEEVSILERPEVPGDWAEDKIITVVSGLPRSGTSLMMQMLDAGGMVCFTDQIREADGNNPRGYFELESVKELPRDASVLDEAGGKVVKIVAPIIPKLPEKDGVHYRVVFMERDLDEVLASQARMLSRLGKDDRKADSVRMKRSYQKMIAAVNDVLKEREIPVIAISYADTVARPEETIDRLQQFCGAKLSESAMRKTIDPTLYRERKS